MVKYEVVLKSTQWDLYIEGINFKIQSFEQDRQQITTLRNNCVSGISKKYPPSERYYSFGPCTNFLKWNLSEKNYKSEILISYFPSVLSASKSMDIDIILWIFTMRYRALNVCGDHYHVIISYHMERKQNDESWWKKSDLILIMTPEKQDKTLELSKHWSPDSTPARNEKWWRWMIKIFLGGGGRGSDTFKTPSPCEQLLPLPTPCF